MDKIEKNCIEQLVQHNLYDTYGLDLTKTQVEDLATIISSDSVMNSVANKVYDYVEEIVEKKLIKVSFSISYNLYKRMLSLFERNEISDIDKRVAEDEWMIQTIRFDDEFKAELVMLYDYQEKLVMFVNLIAPDDYVEQKIVAKSTKEFEQVLHNGVIIHYDECYYSIKFNLE